MSTVLSDKDVLALFNALDTQSTPNCVETIANHLYVNMYSPHVTIMVIMNPLLRINACPTEWLLAKSLFPSLIPNEDYYRIGLLVKYLVTQVYTVVAIISATLFKFLTV